MPNVSFYHSLLPLDKLPSFYIPYYTETVKLMRGVKIVPARNFVSELSEYNQKMFREVGFPCYYIPIKHGVEHYGFILKGNVPKKTPRVCNWLGVGNLDDLYRTTGLNTLFVCEGLKDIYLYLYYKVPAIAMMTNILQDECFEEMRKLNKNVVVIPDNDDAGRMSAVKFIKKFREFGVTGCVYQPTAMHDFGDWLDKPTMKSYVESAFKSSITIGRDLATHKEKSCYYQIGVK